MGSPVDGQVVAEKPPATKQQIAATVDLLAATAHVLARETYTGASPEAVNAMARTLLARAAEQLLRGKAGV